MKYPIKLDDSYTCRGTDAVDRDIHFDDLLNEGDHVGPRGITEATVVRREDGLWVERDDDRNP